MPPSDYEKFQHAMFDELEELKAKDFHQQLLDFIAMGQRCGIDVAKELVDKKRAPGEIVDEVLEKLKAMNAQKGGKKMVVIGETECPHCHGTRQRDGKDCEHCGRTGKIPIHDKEDS